MPAKIGIASNMVTTYHGFRQDRRGVRKVEETRSSNNLKPYRCKVDKKEARRQAFKKKGAWYSFVRRDYHGAGRTDRITGSFVSV